jgi:hypothetical protein
MGDTKRQYSPNHLAVKGLSPANSMIPGGLTQKITRRWAPDSKADGGRLHLQSCPILVG